MTRRREARRRHRAGRRQREPGDAPPIATETPRRRVERDISWTGVAGGAIGFLVFAQAVVYVLFVQNDESKLWSIPPLLLAAVYLPAIWASVVSTQRRQVVLRSMLGVSLLIAVLGGVFIDILLVGVLLIPTTLLAIAGGLVFQGGTRR